MRNGIWVRILPVNVLNLKYERLVHNSAKVVPLQVFGKFSVFSPYSGTESGARVKSVRWSYANANKDRLHSISSYL